MNPNTPLGEFFTTLQTRPLAEWGGTTRTHKGWRVTTYTHPAEPGFRVRVRECQCGCGEVQVRAAGEYLPCE